MFLDADERISPDDVSAFRSFLEHDADPDAGYLLRQYRMIDGLEHYDRTGPWMGRCFASRPGLRLPVGRLHQVPLPTDIPKDRWRRTTIRLQHLSDATPARRQARFDKYREADPDREFQGAYDHILLPPRHLTPWWPRPAELAAVANERSLTPQTRVATDPAISVVVIAQDDEDEIDDVLTAVAQQVCPEPFEVIVVASGRDRTAAIVRERFPAFALIEVDHPVFPGAARNLALELARGRYLTCADSHVLLTPGSLAAQLRAHRAGYALVTGTVQNGTTTWAGWASYFLDDRDGPPGPTGGPARRATRTVRVPDCRPSRPRWVSGRLACSIRHGRDRGALRARVQRVA